MANIKVNNEIRHLLSRLQLHLGNHDSAGFNKVLNLTLATITEDNQKQIVALLYAIMKCVYNSIMLSDYCYNDAYDFIIDILNNTQLEDEELEINDGM